MQKKQSLSKHKTRTVPMCARKGDVFCSLSPAKPTKVYDTYWRFATERQNIFFKRITNPTPPWTSDPVLVTYKFTNAYRASDRVSQFLIRHVIYEGDESVDELFFRIILFKMFNKIETWQLLKNRLGNIAYSNYSFNHYDKILSEALKHGIRIYSAAYIMPSGGNVFGHRRKHRNNLLLLERMMQDDVPSRIADTSSLLGVFKILRSYPLIGDFLAYQYTIDINYSKLTDHSEMDFVMPGPGARDGLRKCFSEFGGLTEAELIRLVAERQEVEFQNRGLDFRSLWGRRLQLIDCQNLFCEVDKYSRVFHPEIMGITGRTRIKQKYQRTEKRIAYWYPPKWGINEQISVGLQSDVCGSHSSKKEPEISHHEQ